MKKKKLTIDGNQINLTNVKTITDEDYVSKTITNRIKRMRDSIERKIQKMTNTLEDIRFWVLDKGSNDYKLYNIFKFIIDTENEGNVLDNFKDKLKRASEDWIIDCMSSGP